MTATRPARTIPRLGGGLPGLGHLLQLKRDPIDLMRRVADECGELGEFRIGGTDVRLGEVAGAEVWISGPQFEAWRHTQLILDVVPGRGGMFSLDNGRERRFLTRSRVFGADEVAALPPL